MQSIQLREEHWIIADLIGKGGHIRTVPIPLWVKKAVDAWTEAVQITEGHRHFSTLLPANGLDSPQIIQEAAVGTTAGGLL